MRQEQFKAYKWMLPGRLTPIQKNKWPVRAKAWTPEIPDLKLCSSGWHGIERKDILTHFPIQDRAELWTVEARGQVIRGEDKFCVTQMRLLTCVAIPTREQLINFALDCAEECLVNFEIIYPDDPRVRSCIETARAYINGKATLDEVIAARCAARSADSAAGTPSPLPGTPPGPPPSPLPGPPPGPPSPLPGPPP